jgi:hypothetical protein
MINETIPKPGIVQLGTKLFLQRFLALAENHNGIQTQYQEQCQPQGREQTIFHILFLINGPWCTEGY